MEKKREREGKGSITNKHKEYEYILIVGGFFFF